MLFSQSEVAELVSSRFEPTWQSVRPAPAVSIDFGGGRVVRRTLMGNVATWILDADGTVLDVIGGLYEAAAYRARLDEALRLSAHVRARRIGGRNPVHVRDDRLAEYHRAQAGQLEAGGLPLTLHSQGVTKAGIERWALRMAMPTVDASDLAKAVVERPTKVAVLSRLAQPLAADVRLNETARRLAVHRMLAQAPATAFDDAVTRRVYRDVLHCDLDDPWLGLGQLLFASYPFAR